MFISHDMLFDENYFPFAHHSQVYVSSFVPKSSQTIFPILFKKTSHALLPFDLFVHVPSIMSPVSSQHSPTNSSFVAHVIFNDICSSTNISSVPSSVMPISHISIHPQ